MEIFKKDLLIIKKFSSRKSMGAAAAAEVALVIKDLLKTKENISMIFSSAPSQNEFHEELAKDKTIEFNRIIAFHTDEYVGIPEDAPQNIGYSLRKGFFGKCGFGETHYINGLAENLDDECKRYADLALRNVIDIACIGIGENTRLAFNDPGAANFHDSKTVKLITLDLITRYQQVNDGVFKHIDQVPARALTLTVPCIFNSSFIFCTVPARTKAHAVYQTLSGKISEKYPASIIRNHQKAVMYIDAESGLKLGEVPGLVKIL